MTISYKIEFPRPFALWPLLDEKPDSNGINQQSQQKHLPNGQRIDIVIGRIILQMSMVEQMQHRNRFSYGLAKVRKCFQAVIFVMHVLFFDVE